MADHSAAGVRPIYYQPANPQFPILPDGITSVHLLPFVTAPGLHARGPTLEVFEHKSADDGVQFEDWYLGQIWRTPTVVDFGNITAAKQRTVNVHNSNRFSVTLTAIDVSAIGGLSVLSPGLPVVIEAFSSVLVTFEVTVAGTPAFDDLVQFTVDGVDLPVRMIGRRIIIFNTLPQRPIVEKLSWLTDNMVAVDGTEQAFSLRAAPRTRVTLHQRFTDDEERTRQQALILGAGFLRQGVQLWWQSRQVTAEAAAVDLTIQVPTASMETQVGGDVSFVTPAGVAIEGNVASFTASSITLTQAVGLLLPLGTNVMPLNYGFQINKANIATFRTAAEDTQVTFDLLEYSEIPAVDLAYFALHPTDGLPVITEQMFFQGQTRKGSIDQDIQRIDGQTGDIGTFRDELLGRPTQRMLVHCNSLADQHAWRQFLHFIRGSWGRFYVPTDTNDLPLAAAFSLGGNTFTIPSMGLQSLLANTAPRRDLKMVVAGLTYFRRITSVVDNGVIETVTIDGVIPGGGSVPVADVRVSWLTLARLVGDAATFRHTRLGVSQLRFSIRGVIEA